MCRFDTSRTTDYLNFSTRIIMILTFTLLNTRHSNVLLNVSESYIVELYETECIFSYQFTQNYTVYKTCDKHNRKRHKFDTETTQSQQNYTNEIKSKRAERHAAAHNREYDKPTKFSESIDLQTPHDIKRTNRNLFCENQRPPGPVRIGKFRFPQTMTVQCGNELWRMAAGPRSIPGAPINFKIVQFTRCL